jgi:hypothetical protein
MRGSLAARTEQETEEFAAAMLLQLASLLVGALRSAEQQRMRASRGRQSGGPLPRGNQLSEAARRFGANGCAMAALAAPVQRRRKVPLIGSFVRPSGFEPETCGAELGRMQRSVVIRITWSTAVLCVPMSEEMRTGLLLWLQNRLLSNGSRELRGLRLQIEDSVTRSSDLH